MNSSGYFLYQSILQNWVLKDGGNVCLASCPWCRDAGKGSHVQSKHLERCPHVSISWNPHNRLGERFCFLHIMNGETEAQWLKISNEAGGGMAGK